MNPTLADISLRLRQAGTRPSHARVAVAEYLLSHSTHPTVDELYREVSRHTPGLSRTTIYNSVRALIDCGAVTTIEGAHEGVRVDWLDKPHAHLVCERCGSVTDVHIPMPRVPEGLTVRSTQVVFKGLCSRCAGASSDPKLLCDK